MEEDAETAERSRRLDGDKDVKNFFQESKQRILDSAKDQEDLVQFLLYNWINT